MAEPVPVSEYVRFEVYIPTYFYTDVLDEQTGEIKRSTNTLDPDLVQAFIEAALARFHGVTESNPAAPSPFRGWWREAGGAELSVDRLIFVFGLVKPAEYIEALQHFNHWKTELERGLHQSVILVTFQSVHAIGDFL